MRKYILLIFISALQACSIENKEEAIKQIDANPNVKTINIDNGDYKENISFVTTIDGETFKAMRLSMGIGWWIEGFGSTTSFLYYIFPRCPDMCLRFFTQLCP